MKTNRFGRTPLAMIVLLLAALFQSPSWAQSASDAAPSPEKLKQLVDLLRDPEIARYLEAKTQSAPPATPDAKVELEDGMSAVEHLVRGQVEMLGDAVPRIPSEAVSASHAIASDIHVAGFARIAAAIVATLGIAALAEFLVRRLLATRGTSGRGTALALIAQFAPLVAFAVVGFCLFFALHWPPIAGKAMLVLLLAVSGFRLLMCIANALLLPADTTIERDDPSPPPVVEIEAADVPFWQSHLAWGSAIFIGGWALVSLMPALGFSPDVQRLAAYVLGLGVLAVGIDAVWKRPSFVAAGATGRGWVLTATLVALWLIWVVGFTGLFWIGVYILILPKAVRAAERAALRFARAGGASLSRRMVDVMVLRGARAAVFAAAVGWLIYVLGLRASAIGESALMARLAEGVVKGVIILLVADLVWQIAKTYIEYRLDGATVIGGTPEAAARNGRLRTLLPIFRNTLGVFIAVVAVLMVLSGLGVEVGPLVAGAGIFGVAVGFGAQTLVKDILSGVFYMLDDAFRVGEYIQSGSYKGTVESFSLRSVRLRHHRGPVYTVPFGELGAVQNMSRDWVMEKMTISITYDSDVELARKLIKKIGQELAEDPDFASSTIQPVKMQGIDSFGDSGLVLRMKLMTKPGEQFGIKRKAFVMIKKAFDENGIKLAVPTVQVSGGDADRPAAAAKALQKKKEASRAQSKAAEAV